MRPTDLKFQPILRNNWARNVSERGEDVVTILLRSVFLSSGRITREGETKVRSRGEALVEVGVFVFSGDGKPLSE